MTLHPNTIKLIAAKELRDLLRDRRTLFVMIVLPLLLYPLLFLGFIQLALVQAGKLQEQTVSIVVISKENAPEIAAIVDTVQLFEQVDSTNWREKITSGDIEAAIRFEENFADSIAFGNPAAVSLYYNSSRDISRTALNRLQGILDGYSDQIVEQRIVALNSDPKILKPVAVVEENLASAEQKQGQVIGQILGYLLIFVTFSGALYAALDLTAGEKERGTLETLLVTPVAREDIVYGKFSAIAVVSVITAVLNLISLGLTVLYASQILDANADALPKIVINPLSLILVLWIIIPLAVLFSGICLAVAISARNYKEGQSLLTPLYLAIILPAMVGMLPGVEAGPALALVPIANVSLLIKEFMLGNYPWLEIVLTFVTTTGLAILALGWATNQFNQEAVIFRHAEDVKWNPFRRRAMPFMQDSPTPASAILLAMVTVILLAFIGSFGTEWSPVKSVLMSQLIVILPLIFVVYRGNYNAKKVLSLRMPRPSVWPAAVLVALGGWIVTLELTAVQHSLLPFPEDLLKQFTDLFAQLDQMSVILALGVVSLLPAVAEELLCRGFMLSAFRSRLGSVSAIIVVAVIFGFLHMNPYRLLPTVILGLLLGFVAVQSGSIFPAMLCHFLNNALSYLVQKNEAWFQQFEWLSAETDFLPWFVVVAGIAVMAAGLLWMIRIKPAEGSESPTP